MFGEEGGDVGVGDVAAEDFLEVFAFVAFGLDAVDPDGTGADAVGAKSLCQPLFGRLGAFAEVTSGAVGGHLMEANDQGAAEGARGAQVDEGDHEVQEEGAAGVGFLGAGTEGFGGLTGQLGPTAAGEVGQDQERLPDVGGVVVEFGRHVGPGVGDGLGVVLDEAGALGFQVAGLEVAQAVAVFGGDFALHADQNAAVRQCVGEFAGTGHDFGTPGRKTTQKRVLSDMNAMSDMSC